MSAIVHARITKTTVERLLPDQVLRDTDRAGFGVRRRQGPASYFLQKRVQGRVRWITIGRHGAPWTAETARRQATKLLGDIAGGGDPIVTQRAQKALRVTVEEAAELFIAQYGVKLKPRTLKEYKRLLRLFVVPALGKRPIEAVSQSDVTRLHVENAPCPAQANFILAVLSKLLSWAEEFGLRPHNSNSCRRIKKFRVGRRERYLTVEEFARLGAVLDALEESGEESLYALAAVRLLALTGARLNEVLELKWRYVDLSRGLIFLPDSKTGQKPIRLSTQACSILSRLPRLGSNDHVIVGRGDGAHLVNLQKPWRRIRTRAALHDVRLHDLRHSFASIAAASGASLPMIGKLLGHTQPQTTARYAHLADDPITALNQDVGNRIAAAMHGSLPRAVT